MMVSNQHSFTEGPVGAGLVVVRVPSERSVDADLTLQHLIISITPPLSRSGSW
jgi:hypothetical protein